MNQEIVPGKGNWEPGMENHRLYGVGDCAGSGWDGINFLYQPIQCYVLHL